MHCAELHTIWVYSAECTVGLGHFLWFRWYVIESRDRICSLKTAFILTTTDTDDWEMIVTVSSTNIWPNLVKLLWIHQKIDHQQQIPTQPIRFRLKASGISYIISIPPFSPKILYCNNILIGVGSKYNIDGETVNRRPKMFNSRFSVQLPALSTRFLFKAKLF